MADLGQERQNEKTPKVINLMHEAPALAAKFNSERKKAYYRSVSSQLQCKVKVFLSDNS